MARVASIAALMAVALLAFPALSSAAATRAEYAAQADPICAAANKDISQLNKRAEGKARKGKFGAAGKLVKKTGRRLAGSIEQVRAIVPPAGDEQLITDWLALIGRIADNNVALGKAIAKRKPNKANEISRSSGSISQQAHDLVQSFPFQSCS